MSGHDTDINVRSKDVIERILSMELVRVTERAAVSAADVAQPKTETRVWSEEAPEMQSQKVTRNT